MSRQSLVYSSGAGHRVFKCIFFFIVVCLSSLYLTPAAAEKRLALVIGNNEYPQLGPASQLRTAVNDAIAMKTALEALGFQVMEGENLTRAQTIDILTDFESRLQKDDIAFFFYAGHGISLHEENYLLPSDIVSPRRGGRDEEDRLADLAIPESRIRNRLQRINTRIAVIVLDACRTNPLLPTDGSTSRAVGEASGLAPPPEARGLLSIYSAGTRQEALDRLDPDDKIKNSVFTRVFVQKLVTPGLGLRAAAFATQSEVANLAASIGHDQVPGVYSQFLGDDIFLAGQQQIRPTNDIDQIAFTKAMRSGKTEDLQRFIREFPQSPLVSIATLELSRTRPPALETPSLPSTVPLQAPGNAATTPIPDAQTAPPEPSPAPPARAMQRKRVHPASPHVARSRPKAPQTKTVTRAIQRPRVIAATVAKPKRVERSVSHSDCFVFNGKPQC